MVDNFSAMLRSGRVSKAKAFIANMINFKPIVGIDDAGAGVLLSKCLSRRAQLEYLLKQLNEINTMKPIRGFHTLYVDNQEEAVTLDKKISDILNIKSYGILNVSTVISLHAGSGALAIAIDQEV